jgi:hypothetical protein
MSDVFTYTKKAFDHQIIVMNEILRQYNKSFSSKDYIICRMCCFLVEITNNCRYLSKEEKEYAQSILLNEYDKLKNEKKSVLKKLYSGTLLKTFAKKILYSCILNFPGVYINFMLR